MTTFQKTFVRTTHAHDEVVDITEEVERTLAQAKVDAGQCTVFTPHATAAITINENDDPNIGNDLTTALDKMVPLRAGWLHDQIDGNAAAHIKSAIVGPSVTIPIVGGRLALGRWQNVFLCEFDGPRRERTVIVSIVS
jgi:secondary thiamine-phosphate synthase enzyme